jgi:omega-6 fatty acid desaturase (delta-12 desaturase)
VTLSEVHSIVPKHLHEKNTFKSLLYVVRDVFCAVIVYKLGWMIDPFAKALVESYGLSSNAATHAKWALWALYWHTQGVVLAGWWCMAHEAGHGSLSNHGCVNHLIGYTLHTVCPSAFVGGVATNCITVSPSSLLCLAFHPSCPSQSYRVHGT